MNLKPETELLGIHPTMPSEEYHASAGLSFTGFKHFLQSPAHYRYFRDNPKESTDSQILGQLVHALVLEPDTVPNRFALIEGPMNKNPWKQQKDEAEAKGLICVGGTNRAKALGMAEAVLKHPKASHLVKTGVKEASGFAIDPQYGILRKCRPDIWNKDIMSIADLKYVDDASEDGFLRQVLRMKYHYQSAWYLDVWGWLIGQPIQRHIHICVEEDAPHAVQLHCLSDADIEASRQAIQRRLGRYAECLHKNEWPAYPTGIIPMVLPHYAYKTTDEGEVMA